MIIPPDDYMSSNNEKLCITFFRELFTIEDLTGNNKEPYIGKFVIIR